MSATSDSQSPLTSWQPGTPVPRPTIIPFGDYDEYRDPPPDGLIQEDVELIWWLVASCHSKQILRSRIEQISKSRDTWDCLSYQPIADMQGNGRYPQKLVMLLLDSLPRGVCAQMHDESSPIQGGLVIQTEIWHLLSLEAIGWCPIDALPPHLRDIRFSVDLGL
jgi:hypothetical protein